MLGNRCCLAVSVTTRTISILVMESNRDFIISIRGINKKKRTYICCANDYNKSVYAFFDDRANTIKTFDCSAVN